MMYVGIDPGLDGAIALLREDGDLVEVYDAPTLTVKGGSKVKRRFNIPEMRNLIPTDTIAACIEQVGVMPKQGIVSAFCFGEGYGIWQGLVVSRGIPIHFVRPQTWKKSMMNGMGKEKDASRLRVMQLYPQQGVADRVRLMKDHGRADAILIARWLWMRERGR